MSPVRRCFAVTRTRTDCSQSLTLAASLSLEEGRIELEPIVVEVPCMRNFTSRTNQNATLSVAIAHLFFTLTVTIGNVMSKSRKSLADTVRNDINSSRLLLR
jgi:hypothetical protein